MAGWWVGELDSLLAFTFVVIVDRLDQVKCVAFLTYFLKFVLDNWIYKLRLTLSRLILSESSGLILWMLSSASCLNESKIDLSKLYYETDLPLTSRAVWWVANWTKAVRGFPLVGAGTLEHVLFSNKVIFLPVERVLRSTHLLLVALFQLYLSLCPLWCRRSVDQKIVYVFSLLDLIPRNTFSRFLPDLSLLLCSAKCPHVWMVRVAIGRVCPCLWLVWRRILKNRTCSMEFWLTFLALFWWWKYLYWFLYLTFKVLEVYLQFSSQKHCQVTLIPLSVNLANKLKWRF